MSTDVHDLIAFVEESDAFREFHLKNPDRYLAHVFSSRNGTEIGYYNKGDDTIVVFETKPVTARPPEGVFKDGGTVKELSLDDVTVGLNDARETAKKHQEEHYADHPVQQELLILQEFDRPTWNCTLVTQTLNMLNIRIDAKTGEILKAEIHNIMDLRQQ